MELNEITDTIVGFVRQIFFFPESWLTWPNILPYVIVPVFLNWFAFYKILERIGIFGYRKGINGVLAFTISFCLIPIAPITLFFSIATIAFIGLRGWKARIIFFAILIAFYVFVLPYLSTIKF